MSGRSTIQTFGTKRKPRYKATPGERHCHGCSHCQVRYQDACKKPDVNGRCFSCSSKTGSEGFYELLVGQAARDCCFAYARPADRDELASYKLAGDADWFICPICWRQFPFYKPEEFT